MDRRLINPPSVAPSDHFKSHWWRRPGWSPGRRMYTFFLTFQHSLDTAEELSSHYRTALAVNALDVVPPKWMHLTVQGLGFVDEVPPGDLPVVLGELAKHCANVRPIRTKLGKPIVAEEGVVVRVSPADELSGLKTLVRQVLAEVRNPALLEGSAVFNPHVTLAYANRSASAARTIGLLEELTPLSLELYFGELQLVGLGRDHHMYEWEVVSEVQLGGA
jgi:2'-5' RNA ligase